MCCTGEVAVWGNLGCSEIGTESNIGREQVDYAVVVLKGALVVL